MVKTAESPTKQLNFRWTWRPYQQRVLDGMDYHLEDRRLHVIAAPGAGKTTLGLEAFRRLEAPAVVLAPTRIIRDQWLQRLEDFLPEETTIPPDWSSRSLEDPGHLTVVTYQALHSLHRKAMAAENAIETDLAEVDTDEPTSITQDSSSNPSLNSREVTDVIKSFKDTGVRTLILDEAHHLRAEWWKALTRIVEGVDGLNLIALTATPPYDVVGNEWQRYEELCGPIDEEISVPELVRSRTLCPHQDFVWTVAPVEREQLDLADYDQRVDTVIQELRVDQTFREAVQGHMWMSEATPEPAAILDDPEFAVALLIFLHESGQEPPTKVLALFDAAAEQLPDVDRHWWQILVQRYLFVDNGWPKTEAVEQHRDGFRKKLRDLNLLHRRELMLETSRHIESNLALSQSKIQACIDIHGLERQVRGDSLRQAILTDFIREDEEDTLGAWPIYDGLVQAGQNSLDEPYKDIALLTGRLVILHSSRTNILRTRLGDRADKMTVRPAKGLDGYEAIDITGGCATLVGPLTTMLSKGDLRTLVGTRALLGEGWDAPAVNSLIMASYVGSYMLTNQMRGRAIRTNPEQPDKVGTIWHIAAVDVNTESGQRDVENLRRRFDTFVGVTAESGRSKSSHSKSGRIESGLERLSLPSIQESEDLQRWNDLALSRLDKLNNLQREWDKAINIDEGARVVPTVELKAERPPTVRLEVWNQLWPLLRFIVVSLLIMAVPFRADLLFGSGWITFILRWGGILFGGVRFLLALPLLIYRLRLFFRHLPRGGTLREIALVVRDGLSKARIIKTPRSNLEINLEKVSLGVWSISMRGGTFYENSVFTDALSEVIGPIENPRYMIMRLATDSVDGKVDYHAVPSILGTKKELATIFAEIWEQRIGPTELIYTRNKEGRAALLNGRYRTISNASSKPVQRRDRWH